MSRFLKWYARFASELQEGADCLAEREGFELLVGMSVLTTGNVGQTTAAIAPETGFQFRADRGN
jgi:hypothetical protein